MKITIIGTGYVGLVTGVCLADKGHEVICLDIDPQKIEMLNKGISPIYEDGLEELMLKNKDKLIYTTDQDLAYKNSEIIIIGVGTPEKKDGSANLKYVYDVAKEIGKRAENDIIVVVKSTVPIGTNDRIENIINNNLIKKVKISVASNPEFLAQGSAVKDTLHPARIIIGAEDEKTKKTLLKMYKDFDCPKVVTNRKSAEMIKYASNDFLALKISYINEIANLCEVVGANIEDVAKGMGYDDRIGNKFLNAGIGYGGSCFPKDTKALHWLANMNDCEIKTIKAAIEVNENQKLKLIKKARKLFDSFEGMTVAVLGLTFKPNTDDLREAPSLVNIPILLDEGANIKAFDPVGVDNFKKVYPNEITYCNSVEETIKDADVCFIFTEWSDIINYDLNNYIKYMKKPLVFDGRNCYDINKIPKGMEYFSIGR
jgi:UDPglucose 6-dehydrogenase